ncbi:hypothetical protein Tdes44962_MAKER02597 [Teratosphaeria destructans]|uniref:Uncharacterized protein n=1 Tax=Teratosphaeria destructans TaxID=418781 RepID=A0A9W7SSY9_9PEZI|nr:hypothetical protein Tdes44962_MAKER02597 [Teratosphaeria destructans]
MAKSKMTRSAASSPGPKKIVTPPLDAVRSQAFTVTGRRKSVAASTEPSEPRTPTARTKLTGDSRSSRQGRDQADGTRRFVRSPAPSPPPTSKERKYGQLREHAQHEQREKGGGRSGVGRCPR